MRYPHFNSKFQLFFLVSVTLVLASLQATFAQGTVVPAGNVPPANYDASYAVQYIRHETDNQNQIFVPLSSPLTASVGCAGACPNWTVTIGGVPATVTAVGGASGATSVTILFTPAVGIGQTVLVS